MTPRAAPGRLVACHGAVALLVLISSSDHRAVAGDPGTTDGRPPRASIAIPSGYDQRDFPIGARIFRVATNLPPDAIESISWILDGARTDAHDDSATLTFTSPGAHVLEACVTTRRMNLCDRQFLGPRPETVTARNRLITAWVVRQEGPPLPVSGLAQGDFGLVHRGAALEGRILSVEENSLKSRAGICLGYMFDMSGSMLRMDVKTGKSKVFVAKQDGSLDFSPEVRARFEAFANVMRGVHDPEVARPAEDMIMGAVFAGGLLTIGPSRASGAASLPGRIEKALVKEYLQAGNDSPFWTHTALRENVAVMAMALNNDPLCTARKKAIAVDSDLIQFPEEAAVDIDDPTLETIRENYDGNGSPWLLEKLASEEASSMPVYAIDRKTRSYTPNEERKRQAFIRDVVVRSGGETYYLAARSPEEIGVKLRGFFDQMLRRTSTNYDIFWDPEGIDDPDTVKLTLADPHLRATYHASRRPVVDQALGRIVLADRNGRYNNAQKLAAAMYVRKSVEEGRGAPVERSTIISSLEAERRMKVPSGPLIRELERAILSLIREDLKYGRDPATIRRALEGLGKLDALPEQDALDVAGYIPPDSRDQICAGRLAGGKPLQVLKQKLCPPQP